jgi:hypothetical protein
MDKNVTPKPTIANPINPNFEAPVLKFRQTT